MNRQESLRSVNNFTRFLTWRERARIGYSPGWGGPNLNKHCLCIVSTHSSWSNNPDYWRICDQHQKMYGINEDDFSGIPLNVLVEKTSSRKGKQELAERVFRRQRFFLKNISTLTEIHKLAEKHFKGIPFDQLVLVTGASSQHDNYGQGTTSNWLYLTANIEKRF